MRAEKSSPRLNRVAKHYRADGTIVEVSGASPYQNGAPTVFSDAELVGLAVDAAFTI